MEELTHVNPTNCADLERLAAAAETVGYSTETLSLPSDQVISANINISANQSLPTSVIPAASAIIPQYSSNPYDLSRPQQYAAVRFYQSRAVIDQNRSSIDVNQQNPLHTTQTAPLIPRIGNNYMVVQRSDLQTHSASHDQQFGQNHALKSISIAPGTSATSIHYIDARGLPVNPESCTRTEPTIIAVSQAPGLSVPNSNHIGSQQIIHIVQQELPLALAANSNESSMHISNTEKKKKTKKAKVRDSSIKLGEEQGDGKKILEEIPEPVEMNGRKFFVCRLCSEKFPRKYLFRRHQILHTGEKRGALSLETKVEIINRIKAGEKQVDLAMEYNVGRSTLSFIMKNSDKFLGVLKNGKFLPKSKRLRGAQREDVEEALYEWYRQAVEIGAPVSGPILCRKAKDFALKLGYKEFKATHGWLDRFKHRKQIILGRGKPTKEKEQAEEEMEEFKEDFADIILPNILIDYDSNDVFHASEIGLLYKVLPDKVSNFRGLRCAGGRHSAKRLTILMCTNMTGSEKFPLLAIGRHPKPKCFKNVKSLPVQYLSNEKSWMDKDNFTAWLTDLNSWFAQENRKVLLVVPNIPVHPKNLKFSSVRVLVSPSNFVGPCKLGISQALKRNYRRSILEYLLQSYDNFVKTKKRHKKLSVRISLLTCLHKLAAAWHAVTDVTITNSFQSSGLGKYGLWGMNIMTETTLGYENLDFIHTLKMSGMKIPDSFTFDDFVSFDDEVQVCHFMDDDDIIASVTGVEVESSDSEDDDENDAEKPENLTGDDDKENSEESYKGPPFTEVEAHLNIIRNYIAQQSKDSQEMFSVFSHLEYLVRKTGQATQVDHLGPCA